MSIAQTGDFIIYVRTTVRYLRMNSKKFPTIHESISLLDDDTTDEFAMGLGAILLWHFYRNHPIYMAAQDIENSAREAKQISLMIMATNGTTVH